MFSLCIKAMKETLDLQQIDLDSTGRKDNSNIGLVIDGEVNIGC